jgi:hypothetical protein
VFALNLYLFFGFGRGLPLPPRNLTIIDSTVLVALANCALLAWHGARFDAECVAEVPERDWRPRETGQRSMPSV